MLKRDFINSYEYLAYAQFRLYVQFGRSAVKKISWKYLIIQNFDKKFCMKPLVLGMHADRNERYIFDNEVTTNH